MSQKRSVNASNEYSSRLNVHITTTTNSHVAVVHPVHVPIYYAQREQKCGQGDTIGAESIDHSSAAEITELQHAVAQYTRTNTVTNSVKGARLPIKSI